MLGDLTKDSVVKHFESVPPMMSLILVPDLKNQPLVLC